MPVSRQFASEQIMRLSGLRDFPAAVPARKELIAALAEVATNQTHAAELVDAILRGRDFCPTPFDIYGLVEQQALSESPGFTGPKPDRCEGCHDTGWVSWNDDRGISHARRCACMAETRR